MLPSQAYHLIWQKKSNQPRLKIRGTRAKPETFSRQCLADSELSIATLTKQSPIYLENYRRTHRQTGGRHGRALFKECGRRMASKIN